MFNHKLIKIAVFSIIASNSIHALASSFDIECSNSSGSIRIGNAEVQLKKIDPATRSSQVKNYLRSDLRIETKEIKTLKYENESNAQYTSFLKISVLKVRITRGNSFLFPEGTEAASKDLKSVEDFVICTESGSSLRHM